MSYETERDMLALTRLLLRAERQADYWQGECNLATKEKRALEAVIAKMRTNEQEGAPSADTDKGAKQ